MKYNYFIGEIRIPNLIGDEFANTAIQEQIDDLITDYEDEFLRLFFGWANDTTLYDDYIAGIAAGTTAWTSLQTKIYNELIWRSPAAYYIFCKWLQQNATMLTGLGEAKSTAENATMVSDSRRMVRTWNRMSDMVDTIWTWMEDDARNTDYGGFYREQVYYTDHNDRQHSPFEKINSFGI